MFIQNRCAQAENEITEVHEQTVRYLNLLNDRFGNPIGSLRIKNETIAQVALKETYLVRYEFSAIRLIFTYYKNDEGWILNSFKWDDFYEQEFKVTSE